MQLKILRKLSNFLQISELPYLSNQFTNQFLHLPSFFQVCFKLSYLYRDGMQSSILQIHPLTNKQSKLYLFPKSFSMIVPL
jgi:hypothetical protein